LASIHPPIITEADVHAVRAVIAGTASPDEQKRAMLWIGDQACRRMDSPYEPGLEDIDQGVLMGRHMVGVLISNMTTARTLAAAKISDQERAGAGTANFNPNAPDPRINRKRRNQP
jgi:hypothetical protein